MANKISDFRKSAGLTQTRLAQAAGWRSSRISNYERGDRTPDIDDALEICAAFKRLGVDVRLDELFLANDKAA